jgi:heme a synthase
VHRAGALVVALYWAVLLWNLTQRGALARGKMLHFMGLLAVQICFGFANVVYAVPDSLAFIHHVLAVLLLLSALSIACATSKPIEEVTYGRIEHA